jgi:hypothetical protein
MGSGFFSRSYDGSNADHGLKMGDDARHVSMIPQVLQLIESIPFIGLQLWHQSPAV